MGPLLALLLVLWAGPASAQVLRCAQETSLLCMTGRAGTANDPIISTGPTGTIYGSDDPSGVLTLDSTNSGTKGKIFFGAAGVIDQIPMRFGIGMLTPEGKIHARATSQTGNGLLVAGLNYQLICANPPNCQFVSSGQIVIGTTVIVAGGGYQVVRIEDENTLAVQPNVAGLAVGTAWTYQRPIFIGEDATPDRQLLIGALGTLGIGPGANVTPSGTPTEFARVSITGLAAASSSSGNAPPAVDSLRIVGAAGGQGILYDGGRGARVIMSGGPGGASTGTIAGAGGNFGFTGGVGGAGTSSASGGSGGAVNLTSGAGGAGSAGGANGNGGNVTLNAGVAGGGGGTAGTPGVIALGNVSGNVGIGTTTAPQKLTVAGTGIFTAGNELRFENPAATFYSSFKAGAQTGTINYTLPIVAPTTGQVLSSTSAGVQSWVTVGGALTTVTNFCPGGASCDAANTAVTGCTTNQTLNTITATPGAGAVVRVDFSLDWQKTAAANKDITVKFFKDGTEVSTSDQYKSSAIGAVAGVHTTMAPHWIIASESAGSHTYTVRACEGTGGAGQAQRDVSRLTVTY